MNRQDAKNAKDEWNHKAETEKTESLLADF